MITMMNIFNNSYDGTDIFMVYQHQVNMGNIHFKTGQYNKAIKYYRMALDQV